MSLVPAPPNVYYPLGLPPGSVRAILTIQICGLFLLLVVLPEGQVAQIPLFLYALLPLTLVFFAAHGTSIRPEGAAVRSPLYLPRGFFRLLIIGGFVAALGWQYYQNPDYLIQRVTPKPEQLEQWPNVMLALGGGFVIGHILRAGPWRSMPAFQNIVAWVSLLAMLGLLAEVIIEVVIKPGLVNEFNPKLWESLLTGVVAFYFGLRS